MGNEEKKKTAIEEYFGGIVSGDIIACQKIKKQAEKILQDFHNPGKYHYDDDIAQKHIRFIETLCKQPSGKQMGKPLKLELFQRARMEVVFGFVNDKGLRRYQEVLIIEGRKNGKTTETAAVELDLLCNDGEGSPQIYNVATSKDQANLGYNACCKMREMSPELRKHVKKRGYDLYQPNNYGYIKALAANTNTQDGLDIHGAVVDELSAIRNRDLYDLVIQGMGARSQPLLYTISTNGFVRYCIFDDQYEYATKVINGEIEDEYFLPLIYELDSPDEWDNPEMWIKANPGLGTIKSYDFLNRMVKKAKNDPSFKPTVMVKDFNIPQTSESSWLTYEAIDNPATWEYGNPRIKYGLACFDAADTIDLNAAHIMYVRNGDPKIYIDSMYWIPEDVLKASKTRKERDGAPYQLWVDQGYMRTCPGYKCDKKIFSEWFDEVRNREKINISLIAYDPWHVGDAEIRELKNRFGKKSVQAVRQGAKSLSEPMKRLAVELANKNVVYNNNPITKWCLINTSVKTDVNGNIQPVKKLDPRLRIDGTAAMITGYKLLLDNIDLLKSMNKGE